MSQTYVTAGKVTHAWDDKAKAQAKQAKSRQRNGKAKRTGFSPSGCIASLSHWCLEG